MKQPLRVHPEKYLVSTQEKGGLDIGEEIRVQENAATQKESGVIPIECRCGRPRRSSKEFREAPQDLRHLDQPPEGL